MSEHSDPQRGKTDFGSPIAEDSDANSNKSRTRKILRGVGRWSARATLVDVVAKDMRRVRPHYPEIWSEVFSATGLKRLKEKTFSKDTESSGYPFSALVSLIMGLAVLLSGIYAVHIGMNDNMTIFGQLGLAVMIILGAVYTICYGGIIALKGRQRNQAGQSADAGGNASHD